MYQRTDLIDPSEQLFAPNGFILAKKITGPSCIIQDAKWWSVGDEHFCLKGDTTPLIPKPSPSWEVESEPSKLGLPRGSPKEAIFDFDPAILEIEDAPAVEVGLAAGVVVLGWKIVVPSNDDFDVVGERLDPVSELFHFFGAAEVFAPIPTVDEDVPCGHVDPRVETVGVTDEYESHG